MLLNIISSIFMFVFSSLAISGEFEKFSYEMAVNKLADLADKSYQEQQDAVADFLNSYPIPMDCKEDVQEAFEEDLSRGNYLGLYHGHLRDLARGDLTIEEFLSEYPFGRFAPLLRLPEAADRNELARDLRITIRLLNAFMNTIELKKTIVHKPHHEKLAPKILAKRTHSETKQPAAKRAKKTDKKRLLGEFYLISEARDLPEFVQEVQNNPALKHLFACFSKSDIYKELAQLRDDGLLEPKHGEGCLFFEHDFQWLKILQLVQLKKDRKTIYRLAQIDNKNKNDIFTQIRELKLYDHADYYTYDSSSSADKYDTMTKYLRFIKARAHDVQGIIDLIKSEAVNPDNASVPSLKTLYARYLEFRKDEKKEKLYGRHRFYDLIRDQSVLSQLSYDERSFIKRVINKNCRR